MDALLLNALAHKAKLSSLRHAVPEGMIAPDTAALLQWYGVYFAAFPARDRVDVDELQSLIRLRSGNASPESVQLTLYLTESLRNPDEGAVNGILAQLYELDLAGRSAALIEKYNTGEEIDLAYELSKLSQQAQRAKSSATPSDYITMGVDEILAEVANDAGLKFTNLSILNENILGLQPGASIAIAARPDKGKTSLIASVLAAFAPQIMRMYPKGDRPALWLNNEGSGKRIIPRIYQAALRKDLDQIIAMSNQGILVPEYTKAIGGKADLIRVKDIHGASMAQIDQILEEMKPAVCIGDMLANVRLSGNGGSGNKAEAVEQLWQEWRELMVRHNCVGLATIQISQEGGNQLFPPYSALKDSKTGVQGATDVILMMGSLDNPDAQRMRGISTPKNKFAKPGKPSCVTATIDFDGATCSFNDGATV